MKAIFNFFVAWFVWCLIVVFFFVAGAEFYQVVVLHKPGLLGAKR